MSRSGAIERELVTWQRIYDAALPLRDSEPWRWMRETDLFGVRDPESGELITCCVFGQGGEVRGLSAYRGAKGLESLLRLLTRDFDRDNPVDALEAYLAQRCWVMTISDQQDVHPSEERIIERLGLYDDAELPRFRSHHPGCEPWLLEESELRAFATVLEQAGELLERVRDDRTLLHAPADDVLLTRVPDLTLQGVAWRDAWISPPTGLEAEPPPFEMDAARLRALRELPFGGTDSVDDLTGTWEVDYFVLPSPVRDHPSARPHYPFVLLVVEQESGRVIAHDTTAYASRDAALRELITRAMEDEGHRPLVLWARREGIADALQPLADCIELHVEHVDDLLALEPARASVARSTSLGVGAA